MGDNLSMKDIKMHLRCASVCKIEDRIYFSNITFNGLFYLDINDLSVHFVHQFSEERFDAIDLSTDKNVIYFFPNSTNTIMRYDVLKQQEKMIPIQSYNGKSFQIAGIAQRQDLIYMFPGQLGQGIYIFDLHKQKVEKDKTLSLLFGQASFCGNVILEDNSVLLSMYGKNQLVEINLDTKKIINLWKFEEKMQIDTVHFDGDHYWILQTESTDIYEWNRENDTLQVYTNKNPIWADEVPISSVPYSNMIFLEDEILVLNYSLKSILRINKEKKTIENPIEFSEEIQLDNCSFSGFPIYSQYTILEDKILLYPYRGNMLLVYDKETGRMSGKDLIVSEKEIPYLDEVVYSKYMKQYMKQGKCRESGEQLTLEDYIVVIEKDIIKNQDNSLYENVGRLIYQELGK